VITCGRNQTAPRQRPPTGDDNYRGIAARPLPMSRTISLARQAAIDGEMTLQPFREMLAMRFPPRFRPHRPQLGSHKRTKSEVEVQ